jgi:hypothetical protein
VCSKEDERINRLLTMLHPAKCHFLEFTEMSSLVLIKQAGPMRTPLGLLTRRHGFFLAS